MRDAIDQKLIDELETDGRATYADLASKLGIGVSTVSRRIDRLRKDNIIKVVAIPNLEKLGYRAHAIISLNVELKKVDKVCAMLNEQPNVQFVAELYGRFDVIMFAHFSTHEELHEFIKNELSTIDGVTNIETSFIVEMKKRYGGPFPKD